MYALLEVAGWKIEFGITRAEPEVEVRDMPEPMRVGFWTPDDEGEVMVDGRHRTDTRRADAAARRH